MAAGHLRQGPAASGADKCVSRNGGNGWLKEGQRGGRQGEGENEVGIDLATGKTIVGINSKYYRPTEVDTLLGDATKAKEQLGWEPEMPFTELVIKMVQSDWRKVKKRGY